MSCSAVPDHRARLETTQIENVEIELPSYLGVRRQHDLKPAVEPESIDDISSDATADAVGGFEHHHVLAGSFSEDGAEGRLQVRVSELVAVILERGG